MKMCKTRFGFKSCYFAGADTEGKTVHNGFHLVLYETLTMYNTRDTKAESISLFNLSNVKKCTFLIPDHIGLNLVVSLIIFCLYPRS